MITSYKYINFNGETLQKVLNSTIDTDIHSYNVSGSREIIEEKISGRDIPYFYKVDVSPLEFDFSIAFEEYLTKAETSAILRKFLNNKTYKEIYFFNDVSDKSPVFNIIIVDEPEFEYIGRSDKKVIGSIKFRARCDRPYGYLVSSNLAAPMTNGTTYNFYGDGDTEVNLTLLNASGNTLNNVSIGFMKSTSSTPNTSNTLKFLQILPNEQITINAAQKTISTNSSTPIYPRIDRNVYNDLFLISDPDTNGLTINKYYTTNPALQITALSFKAPKYI